MLPSLLTTDAGARGTGRVVLRALLGALGGAAASFTVLGFFGERWWLLDLLANFRVQYLVVLGVTGALYGLFVGRAVGAVLLAAGAVNLVVVVPFLFETHQAPDDPGPTLTVTSFNVQASNRNRARVVDWLREHRADLVFLLESTFEWEASVAGAADLPYRIVAPVPDRYTFGISLLARDDVAVVTRDLVFGDRPVVEASVEFDGGTVQVLGVHPRSPTSPARADSRDRHLAAAALWARGRTGPVVVVGDLNASPWSAAFRRLKRDGDLDDSLAGFGFQPSWPAGWGPLMIPIDHALHSDDLDVVDRSTGPALGSDHRSLTVSFIRERG